MAVLAATAVLGLGATSAVAATSAPHQSAASTTTEYAVGVPVCSDPVPGQEQCQAIRREVVAKGTSDAKAFTPLTGTTTIHATAGRSTTIGPGPAGGYTPSDLAAAYNLNPAVGGSNQTVAIVDAFNDPSITADLDHFDANYGLPAETSSSFEIVNEHGTSTLPANDNSGWSVEESLDVDAARGICHNCKIILVEADDQDQTDFGTAVDTAAALGATEISNSYGVPETYGETMEDPAPPSLQSDYNHPGVVITASTGDDGWYDFDYKGSTTAGFGIANSPLEPSSLPSVIGVGGTTLQIDHTTGARTSETVWNDDGVDDENQLVDNYRYGATGGGCSTLYTAGSWQASEPGYSTLGCGTYKSAADISADADYLTGYDVYDSYKDGIKGDGAGWETIGGTSLSAPTVAAMWALAGGAQGATDPATTLYGHTGTSDFFDVASGGNGWCDADTTCQTAPSPANTSSGTTGLLDCGTSSTGLVTLTDDAQCDAEAGFDGPTGLGSPTGVAALQAHTPTSPMAKIALPSRLELRHAATFSGTGSAATTAGASVTSESWSWGDGSAGSTGATATHTFTKAGTFTVGLTVSDSNGLTASTSTKVTVGEPLIIKAKSPTKIKRGKKSKAFKASATDPNTGGKIATYRWSWGGKSKPSSGKSAKHKFTKKGKDKVTLTVTDNTGVTTSKSFKVKVKK